MFKYLIAFIMFSSNLYAAKIDVVKSAIGYFEKNNFSYVFDKNLVGKKIIEIEDSYSNRQGKSLSDILLILKQADLTIIHDSELDMYSVVNERDARYYPSIPLVLHESELDKFNGHLNFIYKIKHVKNKNVLVRQLMAFLSRYGRVNNLGADELIIMDSDDYIKSILSYLKKIDTEEMANNLKEKKERREMMTKKEGESWGSWISSNFDGLTLLVFFMISMLWGFLLRGYLIRKIEGGL